MKIEASNSGAPAQQFDGKPFLRSYFENKRLASQGDADIEAQRKGLAVELGIPEDSPWRKIHQAIELGGYHPEEHKFSRAAEVGLPKSASWDDVHKEADRWNGIRESREGEDLDTHVLNRAKRVREQLVVNKRPDENLADNPLYRKVTDHFITLRDVIKAEDLVGINDAVKATRAERVGLTTESSWDEIHESEDRVA